MDGILDHTDGFCAEHLDAEYAGQAALEDGLETALEHFGTGLAIGELSLPEGFDGLLPSGLDGNDAFLRCLCGDEEEEADMATRTASTGAAGLRGRWRAAASELSLPPWLSTDLLLNEALASASRLLRTTDPLLPEVWASEVIGEWSELTPDPRVELVLGTELVRRARNQATPAAAALLCTLRVGRRRASPCAACRRGRGPSRVERQAAAAVGLRRRPAEVPARLDGVRLLPGSGDLPRRLAVRTTSRARP